MGLWGAVSAVAGIAIIYTMMVSYRQYFEYYLIIEVCRGQLYVPQEGSDMNFSTFRPVARLMTSSITQLT